MKAFSLIITSFFLLGSVVLAEPVQQFEQESSISWKQPRYPTKMIGDFMDFCVSAMNMRQLEKGNMNPTVVEIHKRVCGCIMDTFRVSQPEEVFRKEFDAATLENVPNFRKYLNQCGQISNNLMFLKHGT